MKTLVFVENHNGKATKAGLEAASYALAMHNGNAADVTAVIFGDIQGDAGLGEVGINNAINVSGQHNSQSMTNKIQALMEQHNIELLVCSHDNAGKEIAPRIAIRSNASLISGAAQMANVSSGVVVKRNVFSGKAIAEVASKNNKVVLTVLPNSFGVKKVGGTCAISSETAEGNDQVKLIEVKGNHDDAGIPLPEADIVVSGGRGMKGPEHWSPIEELAKELGAATACSRPVSDIGWRPHHEHVGQTGIAIRPNLYIAVGISGAIQHLAGVNGSKVIVVINKDAEAPFFKAADYGIVGDAFEVLPQIIAAAKQFNANK